MAAYGACPANNKCSTVLEIQNSLIKKRLCFMFCIQVMRVPFFNGSDFFLSANHFTISLFL